MPKRNIECLDFYYKKLYYWFSKDWKTLEGNTILLLMMIFLFTSLMLIHEAVKLMVPIEDND